MTRWVLIAVAALFLTRLAPPPTHHLRVSGATFVRAGGESFEWRGVTAFRLLEMIAHGRRNEAAAFLDWAAARKLTVVRVLVMARHLFVLAPADGLRALPELLDMAAAKGLYVEVVALADTADIPVAIDAHVRSAGAIAARHSNAILEIANEPAHPTQDRRLHEPRELHRLAALVPEAVPLSWGSAEENPGFAGGDYATMHFPRSSGARGWGHVLTLARGAALASQWKKPVVSDEPIGAAAELIPGRRDNVPARFRGAGLMTRLAGLGATFHYEGGLQGRVPRGRELECFDAWNEAWTLLPRGVERSGVFRSAGDEAAAVTSFAQDRAAGVFERQQGNVAYVVALDVRGDPALVWAPGWRTASIKRLEGVWLITARRSPAGPRSLP